MGCLVLVRTHLIRLSVWFLLKIVTLFSAAAAAAQIGAKYLLSHNSI